MAYIGSPAAPTIATVSDDTITTAKLADDAVTSAKLDTNIAVDGNLTVDTNTLYVDSTNNRVGVGTGSPAVTFDVSGYARASTGILFGTDTAAANALDDYEEGNWTATIDGSTSGPSSLTQVTGTYIKVGRLCYVECYFANVNTTGASGGVRITGLPFSPSPGSQMTGNWGHVNVATWGGTNISNISPFITATYIAFYSAESGGAWAEISHSAGTGRYLNFAGIYRTT